MQAGFVFCASVTLWTRCCRRFDRGFGQGISKDPRFVHVEDSSGLLLGMGSADRRGPIGVSCGRCGHGGKRHFLSGARPQPAASPRRDDGGGERSRCGLTAERHALRGEPCTQPPPRLAQGPRCSCDRPAACARRRADRRSASRCARASAPRRRIDAARRSTPPEEHAPLHAGLQRLCLRRPPTRRDRAAALARAQGRHSGPTLGARACRSDSRRDRSIFCWAISPVCRKAMSPGLCSAIDWCG